MYLNTGGKPWKLVHLKNRTLTFFSSAIFNIQRKNSGNIENYVHKQLYRYIDSTSKEYMYKFSRQQEVRNIIFYTQLFGISWEFYLKARSLAKISIAV